MSLSELTITDINTRIFYIKNPDAGSLVTMIPNYMGDDALAFRLMVDNNIDQYYDHFEEEYVSEKHIAGANHTDLVLVASSRDVSLNRAIAECYLLMSGVES